MCTIFLASHIYSFIGISILFGLADGIFIEAEMGKS